MTDQEKCRALAEKLGWELGDDILIGPWYRLPGSDDPLRMVLEPHPDFAFAVLEELARMGYRPELARMGTNGWDCDIYARDAGRTDHLEGYGHNADPCLAIIQAASAALGIGGDDE